MNAPKVLPIKPNSFAGSFAEGDASQLEAAAEKYFGERGMTVEKAVARGFIPMFDTDERAQVITTVKRHAVRSGAVPLPGFLIDYRDPSGYVAFHYLCGEEDYPTDINSGKKVKLAVPSGRGIIPFMPHGVDWENLPVGTEVHICESAFKAVACCDHGRPGTGLNGVFTWSKDKKITPELIHMFRVRGWIPVITFDANAHPGPAFNPQVAKAQAALIQALFAVCGCSKVRVCEVPYDTIYDQGVDDYFAKGGSIAGLDANTYDVDADGTRPLASSNLGDFLLQEFAAPDPIVVGFIGLGECNLLVSPPKAGKTRIAFTAAVQIASGSGPLLGIPAFVIQRPHKVLLVVLEDAGYNIQKTLVSFCKDLDINPSALSSTLRLVTGIPMGSDVLVKLDGEIKAFKPDLVILDNLTRVEMIEGRISTESSPLQREYQKVNRFTAWGRKHSIAMFLLSHSKKGAGSAHDVSDKTNSTGTMAGAADNLSSIERIPEKHDLPEQYRKFKTNARGYSDVETVVEVGEGPTMFIAEWKKLDISAVSQKYLAALYQLEKESADFIPASAIAARVGGKSVQTVRNALGRLADRGFTNVREGIGGGYRLSPAGVEAVELKKCI